MLPKLKSAYEPRRQIFAMSIELKFLVSSANCAQAFPKTSRTFALALNKYGRSKRNTYTPLVEKRRNACPGRQLYFYFLLQSVRRRPIYLRYTHFVRLFCCCALCFVRWPPFGALREFHPEFLQINLAPVASLEVF